MGKVFYFNDAWTKNEEMVQERGVVREGVERTRRAPVGPQGTQLHKDAAMGMDGDLVHRRGERVTLVGEVPEIRNGKPTGDVIQYYQNEKGGTYRGRMAKVGEGKHVLASWERDRSF